MSGVPVRTYSQYLPEVGYIEFSVPVQNPQEIEAYLRRKTEHLSPDKSFLIVAKLMKIATEMWDGFALWLDDPVVARLMLLQDPDIQAWLAAEGQGEEREDQGDSSSVINL